MTKAGDGFDGLEQNHSVSIGTLCNKYLHKKRLQRHPKNLVNSCEIYWNLNLNLKVLKNYWEH